MKKQENKNILLNGTPECWKMESIVVHKTLQRALNEKQQSADNFARRSYPLTAMSFFIIPPCGIKLAVLGVLLTLRLVPRLRDAFVREMVPQ